MEYKKGVLPIYIKKWIVITWIAAQTRSTVKSDSLHVLPPSMFVTDPGLDVPLISRVYEATDVLARFSEKIKICADESP